MERETFDKVLRDSLKPGLVLPNPGGETSTIVGWTDSQVIYRRKNTKIYVRAGDLYDAYRQFAGRKVTSTELKGFAPRVFDSTQSGHSCNTTFLFMVLKHVGVVGDIEGEGKARKPFYVVLPAIEESATVA